MENMNLQDSAERIAADFCLQTDDSDLSEAGETAAERTKSSKNAVPERFVELAAYLDGPKCRNPKGELNRIKISDALFKVFVLREGCESEAYTSSLINLMDDEQEAYSEAVWQFLNYLKSMSWDPKLSFARYAMSSIKQNVKRIRAEMKGQSRSRGLYSVNKQKDISQKRKEYYNSLQGIGPREKEKLMEEFDKGHYPEFKDVYTESDKGEEQDTQVFQTQTDYEALFTVNQTLVQLLRFMVKFKISKQRKNGSSPTLYPMWYDETITNIMQEMFFAPTEAEMIEDEENVLMKVNYLDVADRQYLKDFLEGDCSTLTAIMKAKYKLKRDFFPEIIPAVFPDAKPGERLAPGTNSWLEAAVPKTYLHFRKGEKHDDSYFSNSRVKFREEINYLRKRLQMK